MYKKDLSWLYFLRRLRSFNVCNRMFYQCVVASAIFFAVVCWGTGVKAKDTNRLNKLIRKAASVVSSQLATLKEVVEPRMKNKMLVIMDKNSQPLYETENSEEQLQPQT